jgi:hypothetical protein
MQEENEEKNCLSLTMWAELPRSVSPAAQPPKASPPNLNPAFSKALA